MRRHLERTMDAGRVHTAAQALDCTHELSKLLDTGLGREQLALCVALVENGVNPEVRCIGSGTQPASDRHGANFAFGD